MRTMAVWATGASSSAWLGSHSSAGVVRPAATVTWGLTRCRVRRLRVTEPVVLVLADGGAGAAVAWPAGGGGSGPARG
eukprot:COSAG04_NODE_874_length_9706_cov_10.058083_11_plen_77_part_01